VTNVEEFKAAIASAEELTKDVDVQLRPHLAAVVLSKLLDAKTRPQAQATPSHPRPALADDTEYTTLGEMIAAFPSRAHTEVLPAIAAHRLRIDGVEELTADDFVAAYRELRLSRPQNLSDAIAKSMRQGWLVPGAKRDGKKTWRVSGQGIAKVGELLG
jgi:hypothetical protein